ncbi:putative serine esterase-domain-containing protein [Peziza echinospora]|nr:putative serine esterase-domain-containing protein [Peziza echinospora]
MAADHDPAAFPSTSTSAENLSGADHLCVLVHGLWGNPAHLGYISQALRTRYPGLHLLLCKRNSGNFTYDGIETGGERVTREIEDALEAFESDGVKITKLSVVGYSLGGLVSRYAVGLLYSRGWFDKIEPVNFTTFATPHLGVRTPLLGWTNHLWNVLGARVLSVSGRQLFLIDDFRNTGRPLLSILADPDSIFYKGLSRFPNKVLYANIVNDRSTCYYTSGISRTDPYANLNAIMVNYVPGYEPNVIDPVNSVSPPPPSAQTSEESPTVIRITRAAKSVAKRVPKVLLYVLFVPIVIVGFLLNSVFQTITSKRRIKLHLNKEGEREGYHYYRRLPLLLVEEMQEAMEGVIEDINQMQEPEHLPPGSEEWVYYSSTVRGLRNVVSAPESLRADPSSSRFKTPQTSTSSPGESEQYLSSFSEASTSNAPSPPLLTPPQHPRESDSDSLNFPTLALAKSQFVMIKNLDDLGWRKFPVWIHNARQSHAAMIVRVPTREAWFEGKVVVRHWLDKEFVV